MLLLAIILTISLHSLSFAWEVDFFSGPTCEDSRNFNQASHSLGH